MSTSNRTVQFSEGTLPHDRQVRPFPNVKVVPGADKTVPEAEAPPPPSAEKAEAPARKKRSVRSFLPLVIGLALLGGAAWYGYGYWTDGRFMISTDDAYVEADMSFVSPKISGYVATVPVSENDHVTAGEPLVYMDDGDYKIALEQAEAQIATQTKPLDRIAAQTAAARAALQQADAQKVSAQAAAANAPRAKDRAAQLVKTRVGTQAQLDDAQTALDQANASVVGADAQIASAKANIDVLLAQYAEAESTVRSLELSRDKAARDFPSPCFAPPMTASSATSPSSRGT